MKKICLLLFILMSSITLQAYDARINGICYNFKGDEATVTYQGRHGLGYYTYYDRSILRIPESVIYEGKTYKVTGIDANTFCNCRDLESVTIPSSVTRIGKPVFTKCIFLESIKVAQGNTVYDSRNDCNAIIETSTNTLIVGCSETVIPENVTSIGSYAFSSCSLTSVTIPNSVTSIGDCAFEYCSFLTSVTIPGSVTSIGVSAFYGCKGLTSVAIPNSVTSIGGSAFKNCSNLTSITIPESVISIGFNTFDGCI